MNHEIKLQILNKIKEYDRIMFFRHVRTDGDCVGATKGFKRIIELTWPEKEVYLIDADGNDAHFKGFSNNLNPKDAHPYKVCTVHTKAPTITDVLEDILTGGE